MYRNLYESQNRDEAFSQTDPKQGFYVFNRLLTTYIPFLLFSHVKLYKYFR